MTGAAFSFTAESLKKADEIMASFPEKKSALLPLLFLVKAQEGTVPESSFAVLADMLSISPVQVLEAFYFYPLLREDKGEIRNAFFR